jgi:hypothetical protein
MRLRVIAGERPQGLPAAADVEVLFESPALIVEGSRGVRRFDGPNGACAFLAGHVHGVLDSRGQLAPVSDATAIASAVFGRSAEECRQALEGRFLLAVVRADGGCEVLSDRFGKRDVYLQRIGNALVAASDLDLLPVSVGTPAYDQTSLAHVFAVYGWRPPKKHTLYQDVQRLGVGETLTLLRGRADVRAEAFTPVPTAPYGEADLNRYADMLLETVRVQASANGNVVYLSSGWDSTSILACLVHLFGPGKVRCVIGRMQYSDRSGVANQFELDRAAAVAAYYKVPLDTVEFDFCRRGPELMERLAPMLRANQVASFTALSHGYLADYVAATTKGDESVFGGEISDGAHNLGFSQFATMFHPVLEFREYADKMGSYLFGPTFLQSMVTGKFASDPIYRWMSERYPASSFDAHVPGDLPVQSRQMLSSFFLRASRMPLASLKAGRVLTEHGRALYSKTMEEAYIAGPAKAVTPDTLYAWYLRLYNSFHWQGSTVATMALTAEAQGLRLALPFWDSGIQTFLSAMPESFGRGLDLNPTKYPLKWALKNRINYPNHLQVGPHSYLYDVDHSFNHAEEVVYHSAFTPYFKDKLKARGYRNVLSPEMINVEYLDGLVTKFLAGGAVDGSELGDLVSLCLLSSTGWYGQAGR